MGREKIVFDRCSNSETWKAVKGHWDGSSEDNGERGCGVVIEGVDRSRWVTTSRIAVPLKVGTAVASEVAGVCVPRESFIWSSTNACVFRVSISASTESSTIIDVAVCELVCAKM